MLSIKNEINHFNSYPKSMRYLLFANLLYAFVLPVIELFVGAYIVSPPDGAIELTFAEKQQNINFYLYYQPEFDVRNTAIYYEKSGIIRIFKY